MLNNPWIIGIGGGILSGLIVTLISRVLFTQKDKREYAQKILTVNREVTYAVKPGITEGEIPSINILKSLIKSTARKYNVDDNDVYSPSEIADDLIKEVMDSSFISAKTKSEYCKNLQSMKDTEIQIADKIEPKKYGIEKVAIEEFRDRTSKMLSMVLGIITALMTVTISFTKFSDLLIPSNIEILLPTIITIIALFITTLTYLTYIKAKKVRRTEIDFTPTITINTIEKNKSEANKKEKASD